MNIRKKTLCPGVNFTALETDKFKTDTITIRLLTPLDRETVSKCALIPKVLLRGSIRYPNITAINARCDNLYGASISDSISRQGEILSFGFTGACISNRVAPESGVVGGLCELITELLLRPATQRGLLRKDYVESEKEKLTDEIRAKVNSKGAYAQRRLIEKMCAYEAFGVSLPGTEADVSEITYIGLTKAYKQFISTCPIEIFYCGSSSREAEEALELGLTALPRGEINWDLGTDIRMNSLTEVPRRFEEEMDIAQARLALGFRLGSCMENPNLAAIRVFNALYGGGVMSRLFLKVREELSLCYSAFSGAYIDKGILIAMAGIDAANREEAEREILNQLEQLRRGEYSDEELEQARQSAAGDFRGIEDNPAETTTYYFTLALRGLEEPPDVAAQFCLEVTREDISEVVSGIELDSVYFLHPAEGCECTEEYEEEAEYEED